MARLQSRLKVSPSTLGTYLTDELFSCQSAWEKSPLILPWELFSKKFDRKIIVFQKSAFFTKGSEFLCICLLVMIGRDPRLTPTGYRKNPSTIYLLNFEADFFTFFRVFLKNSLLNKETAFIRTGFLLRFDIAFHGKVIEL
jgi:hypothetical protein